MSTYAYCSRLTAWSDLDHETAASVIRDLVRALARINAAWRGRHPDAPLLYDSGVVYRGETDAIETLWIDAPAIYEQGYADCKGLAAARIGELWWAGVDADAIVGLADDESQYHVQVETPWGIEDPSLEAGM